MSGSESLPAGLEESRRRDSWLLWGPILVVSLVGFIVAWQFVDEPPPKKLVIGTGSEGGAYHAFAERYAEILARDGFEVEVRATNGSVENLELLKKGAVDFALVQGGTAGDVDGLRSVCSLYYEPLWIFGRVAAGPLVQLNDLAGRKIAVGPEGSGTRALALTVLADCDVDADEATLLPLSGDAAAQALIGGAVDAVFLVGSPRIEVIRVLSSADGIELMHVGRAAAYRGRHRYLDVVEIPEGLIDMVTNRPPTARTLVAATAALVAPSDLNAKLIPLLIDASREVHGGGGLLEEPGRFPSPEYCELPVFPRARRYFDRGPTFLYRVLPYRVAGAIDRLKILLLPLFTLFFPLFKLAPPLYRWRIRYKVIRWYRTIRTADRLACDPSTNPDVLRQWRGHLARMEHEVANIYVPLSYMCELYDLSSHVRLVIDRIDERLD